MISTGTAISGVTSTTGTDPAPEIQPSSTTLMESEENLTFGLCPESLRAPLESTTDSIEFTINLTEPEAAPGSSIEGTLRVTNLGTAPLVFKTPETLLAFLYEPGGTEPVARGDGPELLVLNEWAIEPGGFEDIPLLAGTHSCDQSGTTNPPRPGAYEMRVQTGWGFTAPIPFRVIEPGP